MRIDEQGAPSKEPLPRKPLPESARSSNDLMRVDGSVPAALEALSVLPRRKPVGGAPQPEALKASFSRRPLGPRPLSSDAEIAKTSLPGIENQSLNSTSPSFDHILDSKINIETNSELGTAHLDSKYGNDEGSNYPCFSITIIRRDPSSGAQWNIGTVDGYPDFGEGPDRRQKAAHRRKKPYYGIELHLETPGYSSFRNSNLTDHLGDTASTVYKATGDRIEAGKSRAGQASKRGFDRQVRMEGSSFWKRPTMQHNRALSDLSGKRFSRSSSGSSTAGRSEAPSFDPQPRLDSNTFQPKGYVFFSPWNGRCKFSTGTGGRSLRCKHTLPGPLSASRGPDFISTPQASVIVSELRFNLPSSAVFTSSTAASMDGTSGAEHKRFSIPKLAYNRHPAPTSDQRPPLPPRPHATSYAAMYPSDDEAALPPQSRATESSDEEHIPPLSARTSLFPYTANAAREADENEGSRLDLSIGQENAGGGNRGKRAKLGKLIIHDEGLKMLDLVISANMGVWWSVWESENR